MPQRRRPFQPDGRGSGRAPGAGRAGGAGRGGAGLRFRAGGDPAPLSKATRVSGVGLRALPDRSEPVRHDLRIYCTGVLMETFTALVPFRLR